MISAGEQITRLRALLERIQLRAAEPRPARFLPVAEAPVAVEPEVEEEREPTLPGHAASAAVVEAPIEPAFVAPEVIEEPVVEPLAEEVRETAPAEEVREAATLEEAPIEPAIMIAPEIPVIAEGIPIEAAPIEPTPEPPAPILTEAAEAAERVEAVSGEFAVAEVPMELEELGPADELHEGEHVVEIHVEEPVEALSPVVEDGRPIENIVAENAPEFAREIAPVAEQAEVEEERISEPPASGRELVATPYESQRLAVAAPATPDQHGLEPLLGSDGTELAEEPEAPPASSRNLRAEPAVPSTSDIIELQPPPSARIAPIPEPEPEPERALESEPAPALSIEPARVHVQVEEPAVAAAEPQQVAIAAAVGHAAARPVEQVVVGIDADVIHAELTPADVAAFIGAARAPRPETFGVLLDAALDL